MPSALGRLPRHRAVAYPQGMNASQTSRTSETSQATPPVRWFQCQSPTLFCAASWLTASLLACGCTPSTSERLDTIGESYLTGTFEANPGAGTSAGRHEYDGRTVDLSKEAINLRRADLQRLRHEIDFELIRSDDQEESLRGRVLKAAIDGDLFALDTLRSFSRNPMTYAGAVDVSIYGKRDFAPKADRLRDATRVLAGVPAVVAAAKANLDSVLPRVYIETAIKIAEGQAEFAQGDLLVAFADVNDEGAKARLKTVADIAAASMKDYVQWLKSERLPKATAQFAIGREGFARMLRDNELISQTPEEILAIGLKELDRQTRLFEAAAREIDPSRSPREVWAALQHDHPTAENLLADTRAHLAAIRGFLVDKDIIRFPTAQDVIVDETPSFLRATSFASMDTPGVFEKKATESFYYVTLPDRAWDKAKSDEWLTAFNYYTTDVVSIHEALPGHFVQALHLHDSGVEGAQGYVGSYAFIEGWAHYCEEMVLDEGFPPESLRTTPNAAAKYRMAQASEALLRCCRLVSAIRMHCQGQSLDDATKFFVEKAYYEEAPARSEAERGSYDPGYCLYTVGKLQILKLREDWKKQEGDAFTLRRFHDELLRHGQPQIRLLREWMLRGDAAKAPTL